MQDMISVKGSSTFVLVHGAHGGAWCWDKMVPNLSRLGHKVYALDLPGHGSDFSPLAEQTLSSYTDKVVDFLDTLEGKVILVGHSMGGAVITAVGEKRPEKIEKLVYVSAALLSPGQSVNGPEGMVPVDWRDVSKDGKTFTFDTLLGKGLDVAAMVSKEDFDMMVMYSRGEAMAPLYDKVYPTEERWGKIRRFFIFCTKDNANTPEVTRGLLEKNPCERVYQIETDHYPQLATPIELTVIFHEIAGL